MSPFLKKLRCVTVVLILSLGAPSFALAAMSSTNYSIPWDSFVSGGLDSGESEQYRANDTIGAGYDAVEMASEAYAAQATYRAGDDRPLSFGVSMASVGGVTAMYSSVSISGRTVTLATATESAYFSVGDLIALVQSPGVSQLVVVGRIVSMSSGVISVDRFDGDTATVSAAPTAGTAYVMLLSGSSVAFGAIASGAPSVATGAVSVSSDVRSGYTVYVVADGNPRTSGGDDIDPVGDGAVSAGSEEYGIEVLGARSALTGDVALSTSQLSVQSSTNRSAIPADRVALIYKVSVSASQTQAGTYSQAVSFTLTPNY